jgi:tetratricopeptide (TPR) repeat protein
MPFMNKNYRTVPYELLVGHSFGGEFATYALLNYPDVFNAYIAISPYMMYDDGVIVKEAKTKLKSSYKNEIQFYMTLGNEPDYFATLDEFVNIVESKSPKNFKFSYVKFEKDNHGSVPHLSIYKGLESIFDDWKLSKDEFNAGIAAIDKHYQQISKKYGYEVVVPELTINALGYSYLNGKDINEAIRVFKENVKRHPNSANVYDSLGEAYETDGQLAEAEKNYTKAVELSRKNSHPNLSIYEKNLERIQQKLAQN